MGKMMADAEARQDLFLWNGPLQPPAIREWLDARKRTVPDDLALFWERTGGGDVFESEAMLSPFGDQALGEDVDSVNAEHRANGMPSRYLVFHVGGCGVSAIDQNSGKYVTLEPPDYRESSQYETLNEWYCKVLRAEYAERYGL